MKLPPTFDVQDRKLIPMFNIYLRISFFNQFSTTLFLLLKKKNDPQVLLQAGNFSSKLAKQFQEDQFTKNKQF